MTRRDRTVERQAALLAEVSAVGGSRTASPPGAFGFLRCLPVLVPLAMFAQIALLGLRPASRESARLTSEENAMADRYEAALSKAERLDRVLRAQRDPIYLERERRLLLAANSPLTGR